MTIEHFRLSARAKDQLVKLKRYTGVKNWNVLCRWGFALSLAESTAPAKERIPSDSNVEMSWKVFGGAYDQIYLALLKQRCVEDGLGTDASVLSEQFRLHLHRGVGYLSADRGIRSITALVGRAQA